MERERGREGERERERERERTMITNIVLYLHAGGYYLVVSNCMTQKYSWVLTTNPNTVCIKS